MLFKKYSGKYFSYTVRNRRQKSTDFSEISSEIPNIRVGNAERNKKGDFIITIISTVEGTICHRCGCEITEFYGYGRETELRHLPIPGHKTYIRIRPERYGCPYCDNKPTTGHPLSWYGRKSRYTRAYGDHILLRMVGSTVSDVSMKEYSGYEAVTGIIGRRTAGEADRKAMKKPDIYLKSS